MRPPLSLRRASRCGPACVAAGMRVRSRGPVHAYHGTLSLPVALLYPFLALPRASLHPAPIALATLSLGTVAWDTRSPECVADHHERPYASAQAETPPSRRRFPVSYPGIDCAFSGLQSALMRKQTHAEKTGMCTRPPHRKPCRSSVYPIRARSQQCCSQLEWVGSWQWRAPALIL